MNHNLNLSICVVLYRAENTTERFHTELLQSLHGFDGWELLYYDNSPTDQLRAIVSRLRSDCAVTYVHDPRNIGFSYANNQLILTSRYARILLLNPDVFGFTAAHWNQIREIVTADDVRFARLLNSDGSFQDCVGEVSSLRRAFSKRTNHEATAIPTNVGMGIMAFMLTAKASFAHVGLLDCDYSLYAEDMDWCHRASTHGKKIIYDPRIELTHIGGASASDRWNNKSSLSKKYFAERTFIDKHYRGLEWVLMRMLNTVKRLRLRFT